MKIVKMILRILLYLLMAGVGLVIATNLYVLVYAIPRMYTPDQSPSSRVAIVFGAGLRRDGSPTPILQDRIAAAADLYFHGKVEKVLMSGDNRFLDYNEPGAMLGFALKLGIPRDDIVLDYAGRRTYDTCYRAKAIFGVREAVLVTQKFHLPRALFLCNALGIKGDGVIATRQAYSALLLRSWDLREIGARTVAMLDAWITHPLPVLGQFEPIFPNDTGQNP